MNERLKVVQLDNFFQQAEVQAVSFPREIMLGEGIMLAVLAVGMVFFLGTAVFRRSATALAAAFLAGITGLMLAMSFDYLGFLPTSSMAVVQAIFIAISLLFLTASVRAARENPFLGAVILLAIIGVVGLGVIGFVGASAVDTPIRFSLVGLAFFAIVLTLHQGFGGDRKAMLASPGVILAASSLLAMIIGANVGIGHWIGAITPNVMLSGGVLLAGLLSLLAGKEEATQLATAEPIFSQPETVAGFVSTEEGADDLISQVEQGETPDELPASLVSFDSGEDKSAGTESDKIPVAAPERQPIKAESPISALWGKRGDSTPENAEPKLAAAALGVAGIAGASLVGAATKTNWEWAANSPVKACDDIAKLFEMPNVALLTPENIRSLIFHQDLGVYDEAILGGEDPATGKFDMTVGLLSGTRLHFVGQREVDEDGLVTRLVSHVSAVNGGKLPIGEKNFAAQQAAKDHERALLQLKEALANGEIRASFQPIVRLGDEAVIGYEALARWHRPGVKKPLGPEEFLDMAIEAGLEQEIISSVLGEAAKELAAWLAAEPEKGQFVTFNVSAGSMINDDLVRLVEEQIHAHGLPDGSLVVELTESHVTENQDKTLAVTKALRAAGARLALDDLGAGFSNLDQLNKFKFDIVKTDKSLMQSALTSQQGQVLLSGLIELARKMGMQVVVEGVEDAKGAAWLQQTGCDFAQGFLYGMPEPAAGEDSHNAEMIANLR